MRILIATVPVAAHFNPLTGPAVCLAELGHDVRWYTRSEYAERVHRLGREAIPHNQAAGGKTTDCPRVRGGRGGLVAGGRIDCSVSRADAPAPLAR